MSVDYCVCACKTAKIVEITDVFCSCGVCGQMMVRDLASGEWKPFLVAELCELACYRDLVSSIF